MVDRLPCLANKGSPRIPSAPPISTLYSRLYQFSIVARAAKYKDSVRIFGLASRLGAGGLASPFPSRLGVSRCSPESADPCLPMGSSQLELLHQPA